MSLSNGSLVVLLAHASLETDGVYTVANAHRSMNQEIERTLRERVAVERYENYLGEVGKNHSIAVMDAEVDRFLSRLPEGAVVLDIGGCWGWHWRRLSMCRPDVGVLIVDFVRNNLLHAKTVLGPLVGTQVALMEADATALPLADAADEVGFDGVWTVQTFQHIPDFETACLEARRVLRRGGRFACYSLHLTPLNRIIYRVLGRPFHQAGLVHGRFHLDRANDAQRDTVARVFGGVVEDRYSECLFHPDLHLTFSGASESRIGRLDAMLSGSSPLARFLARQRSYEVTSC